MERRKLVVIGLDGASFNLLNPWIEQGELPVLARIIRGGTSGDLKSTIPPVTSPAWISMLTGKQPGKLGVFGMVKRREDAYEIQPPKLTWKKWRPVWDILNEGECKTCIINVPCTLVPSDGVDGAIISGPVFNQGRRRAYPLWLDNVLKKEMMKLLVKRTLSFKGEKNLRKINDMADLEWRLGKQLFEEVDWTFFMYVFYQTDELQHFFMEHIDPTHPLHDKYGMVILDFYKKIDRRLDYILSRLPENCNLLLTSDHGQGLSHKLVDLNAWLKERGHLSLVNEKRHSFNRENLGSALRELGLSDAWVGAMSLPVIRNLRSFFAKRIPPDEMTSSNVDWENTKAYSYCQSSIFINMKGREPNGCVTEGEDFERTRQSIIDELQEFEDHESDEKILERVWKKEDIYSGEYLPILPDIVVEFRGSKYVNNISDCGVPKGEVLNDPPHSGFHSSMGILVAYGPDIKAGHRIENAQIFDIAPTILHMTGFPLGGDMDGQVLMDILRPDSDLRLAEIRTSEGEGEEEEDFKWTEEDEEIIKDRLRSLGYM